MREVGAPEREQKLKDLQVYGYCQVDGVLSSAEVKFYKDLVNLHSEKLNKVHYEGRPARDARDKMLYCLPNKDKRFLDPLLDPFVKKVLMDKLNDPYYRFLPPELPNYYLTYYNARSSGEALALHIDSYVPAPGDRTWSMQVVFILEDHTLDNGCTIVVPGSHKSGNFSDRDLKNVQPLLPKAGDLVMWDSRLWHGTMENKTEATRWALVATLGMWWVKPAMDLTRSIPQEIYSQLSDEQKALVGFCCIPPRDEFSGINTKKGYDSFKPRSSDYYE